MSDLSPSRWRDALVDARHCSEGDKVNHWYVVINSETGEYEVCTIADIKPKHHTVAQFFRGNCMSIVSITCHRRKVDAKA